MDDRVIAQLEAARQQLLDLTLRNRLLNFRPTTRTTIRIVDELPSQVWKLLVQNRARLEFLAKEEHELFVHSEINDTTGVPDQKSTAGEGVEGEVFHLPHLADQLAGSEDDLAARYHDKYLQTTLSGDSLQTSLLRIFHTAQDAIEERGVNLLFLAVGFLAWRRADQQDRTLKAPIILIPVELQRTSAKGRFHVAALDDDPVLNPCLVRLLEDLHIEAPEPPESWDDFDSDTFFGLLKERISGYPDWQLRPELYLGFFSFTKYLMYVDLDPSHWPATSAGLLENPLIRAFCGDETALSGGVQDVPNVENLDEKLPPEEVYQVLDADSSQQQAILAAKQGASVVIEGPPGTGKSQTISNVIAECLASGKSILFVSQKMAALEVVKNRLEQVGLGDFCLELHSTKANRKAMLSELDRLLKSPPPMPTVHSDDGRKLWQLRQELNAYVHALHEPWGPARITPYSAIGRLLALTTVPELNCPLPGSSNWDRGAFDETRRLVDRMAGHLRVVGRPTENPWRGVRLLACRSKTARTVNGLVRQLVEQLRQLNSAATIVARLIDASQPTNLQECDELQNLSKLIAKAPAGLSRNLVDSDLWDDPPADVITLLKKLKALPSMLKGLEPHYNLDAAHHIDAKALLERYRTYAESRFPWLSPAYWKDRSQVRRAISPSYAPTITQAANDLERLAEIQATRFEVESLAETGSKYFGSAWRGLSSDAEQFNKLGGWLVEFRRRIRSGAIGPASSRLVCSAPERDQFTNARTHFVATLERWHTTWDQFAAVLQLADPGVFDEEIKKVSLDEVGARLEQMLQRSESLFDWCQYQESLHACTQSGLVDFIEATTRTQVVPEQLAEAFEKQYLTLWLDDVFAEREPLRQFNRGNHESTISEFAELDRRWVEHSRDRLWLHLRRDQPSGGFQAARSSQLGILQGEVRRKRGGRPIRRILRDAGDVVQKLKPCLMMSPLSVAQFIEPGALNFDLVVFDEASQVEPADALGAIARGRQLLLVGDSNQLPPTSFFTAISGETEEEGADEAAGLASMESILDRGSMVLPSMRLRWHYRSRHESLITFSNHEFYDNDLVVFPSSHADRDRLGLCLMYKPEDQYDRGRSQKNRAQARRVAEYVFHHARSWPDQSLGVGAFSQAQQQAIWDEIEKLRLQDDSLAPFFEHDGLEPFIVKNLETIQGDERDVILLSIGYGRKVPGERMSMAFGPLNRDGGWRRLNVLITRARKRCLVFTSILGHDFDLSATQARGVHALKGYLDYADSGTLPQIEVGDGQFGSPFERAVYTALQNKGIETHRQVGCAGYAIDLAVVDPDRPGRYILGIECDGAAYHSSPTARDRDRLRQQVLESLGWRIHRIWSTEWYRKPRTELQRVLAAVEKARRGELRPRFVDLAPATPQIERPNPQRVECDETDNDMDLGRLIGAAQYQSFRDLNVDIPESFYTASHANLGVLMRRIVDCEGPIHQDILARRMAGAYGMGRVGSKIEQRVHDVLRQQTRAGELRVQGNFVWVARMKEPPVRVRSDESDVRKIEHICLEEIGRAAVLILKAQFGMERDDLVSLTARALGLQRTGSRARKRIEAAIDSEVAAGRIGCDDSGVLKFSEI